MIQNAQKYLLLNRGKIWGYSHAGGIALLCADLPLSTVQYSKLHCFVRCRRATYCKIFTPSEICDKQTLHYITLQLARDYNPRGWLISLNRFQVLLTGSGNHHNILHLTLASPSIASDSNSYHVFIYSDVFWQYIIFITVWWWISSDLFPLSFMIYDLWSRVSSST